MKLSTFDVRSNLGRVHVHLRILRQSKKAIILAGMPSVTHTKPQEELWPPAPKKCTPASAKWSFDRWNVSRPLMDRLRRVRWMVGQDQAPIIRVILACWVCNLRRRTYIYFQ